MLVYTSPSYPAYSPPTLYPISHIVPARAPTTRERYLRALADAQSARERYIYELEEQRILASLRQQEALRQAELRHRDAQRQDELYHRAVQEFISRRRSGRPSVGDYCHPVLRSNAEQQFSSRHRRAVAFQRQQEQLRTVEELFEALLGGNEGANDLKVKEGKRFQEVKVDQEIGAFETNFMSLLQARAEHERQAARHNAKVRFMDKLNTIREEAQIARSSRGQTPSAAASSTHIPPYSTPADSHDEKSFVPFIVHLTRQPEVGRDRAARTIQRRWRSHSADAAAQKDALSTIEVLRSRFQFLKGAFSFPEHLEFKERAPGQESEVPALLYTPSNTAVHTYTHELTKLLMNADAVPSGGNRQVREERRAFVRRVEEEIEMVDARVREIWEKRVAHATLARHEAKDASDAHGTTIESTATEHTSNAIDQAGITVDVITHTYEDGVMSSDSAPAEAPVDFDIPASPSTVVPSGPHFAESRNDGSPSEPSRDDIESRSIQYEGGGAVAARTEQDPLSPLQTVLTAVEGSDDSTNPKTPLAVNDAGTDTNNWITGVESASLASQTSSASESAASEVRHTFTSGVSKDSPEAGRADALSITPVYPDVPERRAPSDDSLYSAPVTEPFDVIYPSSPSSISSGLENVSALGTESDVTVKGDGTTMVSEAPVNEVDTSPLHKQDSQDDGFELL